MIKSIGIVGGGQLGRMLTIAAKEMGFAVTVVDPTENCPASQVGAEQIVGGLADAKSIKKLASTCDLLTFEIEHIDTDTLQFLIKNGTTIHPSPQTLAVIKDKLLQNRFLKDAGIPVADFQEITTADDANKAARVFGYPLMLKSRHGGYDGRGNALIKKANEIPDALQKLGGENVYAEKYIPFDKELAVMVARSTDGNINTYPTVETVHKNNILHSVIAPAQIDKRLYKKAQECAVAVVRQLKGAGVFGIEMFLTKDKNILVNEIAPRVHNSGHYTIEACMTSQFAQHIRAITGLPLGSTSMHVPAAVMVNILGTRNGEATLTGLERTLNIPGASIHIYGKKQTRPERKMGHITIIGDSRNSCVKRASDARKAIFI